MQQARILQSQITDFLNTNIINEKKTEGQQLMDELVSIIDQFQQISLTNESKSKIEKLD